MGTYTDYYDGWSYEYEEHCGKMKDWRVHYPSCKKPPIEKPSSFYKYYALNEYSVDALTKMYLYASHPNQFNDPFDCCDGLLDFTSANEEILKAIYYPMFDEFKEVYGENIRNYTHEHFKTLFYGKMGIVSLTTQESNLYLWANYAKENGFCIQINPNKLPFQHWGPFPIHYVENLRPIKIEKCAQTAVLMQTNIKSQCWQSEDEWRLLVSNPEGLDFVRFDKDGDEYCKHLKAHNRHMKYPIEALLSVTLGPKFLFEHDIKCEELSLLEQKVVCYQNPLKRKIPSFLSRYNIPTKVPLEVCNKEEHLHLDLATVQVRKLSDFVYKLFILTNNKD